MDYKKAIAMKTFLLQLAFLTCLIIADIAILRTLSSRKESVNIVPQKLRSPVATKYVGFRLNNGRLGNQLFHLMAGYGIAKTLNRTHYLSIQNPSIGYVADYLRKLKKTFPNLAETFVISPYDAEETTVPFARTCCDYDNPLRLANRTETFLSLTMVYGQNPSYFEAYLPEVRNILQFSKEVRERGTLSLQLNNMSQYDYLCIHIRRTDFVRLGVSTNMNETVKVAKLIAKEKVAFVSPFTESIDFYVASQVCGSFLITAATSTFGWWLAFFTKAQSNVFYLPDNRRHADKLPSKELFLMLQPFTTLCPTTLQGTGETSALTLCLSTCHHVISAAAIRTWLLFYKEIVATVSYRIIVRVETNVSWNVSAESRLGI